MKCRQGELGVPGLFHNGQRSKKSLGTKGAKSEVEIVVYACFVTRIGVGSG